MAVNNDGIDGVKIQNIAGDYFLNVGSGYNSNPSTSCDPCGAAMPQNKTIKAGGQVRVDGPMSQYKEVDSGSTHLTGSIGMFASNKIELHAAAGGITLDTTGNIHLNAGGGMVVIDGNATVDMSANTFQMTTSEGMRMSSPQMAMDTSNCSFTGNVAFDKNLKLNGSLAVQGEFYPTHMTAQKQIMETDEAGEGTGFLNPVQSYFVCNGSSTLAKVLSLQAPWLSSPPSMTPGYIDAIIDLGIIDIPILSSLGKPLKCRIAFPNGVHLVSNMAVEQDQADIILMITKEMTGLGTAAVGVSDFYGPSHSHTYYIPACTLVNSTDEVWAAAQECDSETAGTAKTMEPFGDPWSKIKKVYTKKVKDRLTAPLKRLKQAFLNILGIG